MSEMIWSSALDACLRLVPPPLSERVSRGEALGRLLLEDVRADRDYPIGDLSTMDGYAVQDTADKTWIVDGVNLPGTGPGALLQRSAARRIFTGAEVPKGAASVIPQEMTSRDGDRLMTHGTAQGVNIRLRGSESHQGDIVLRSGLRIGSVELALLAALGCGQVIVGKRPRVAHISTGDELAEPDERVPGFRIRDSNSGLVTGALEKAGFTLVLQQRVGDNYEELRSAIESAVKECEVLLVSGGASVGDHDHTRSALTAIGFDFVVDSVRLRPGKPTGIAHRNGRWAVALAGNPVSHVVALELFVLPLLRALEGEVNPASVLMKGFLDGECTTGIPKRPTFWPARISIREGKYFLSPLRFLSSGDLIGMAGANALLFLDEGAAIPANGAAVRFLPLHL